MKLKDPGVPAWARDHYEGKLRYMKQGTSLQKQEFLTHLLQDNIEDSN